MTFANKLSNPSEFLLLDGAMGTLLQEFSLQNEPIPELYNFTQPDLVTQIHRKYVQAGSQIILTNTLGANAKKIHQYDITPAETIQKAVSLAREAIGENEVYVALDIGPIGSLLEPIGTLSFEQAYVLFKEQIIAGQEAGADLIYIETVSDLYEAKAAILAAKENCNLPVFCTMTFQDNGRTLNGTDPETMVHVLEGLGVDALGVNCSLGPAEMSKIIQILANFAHVPIIIKPNAGLPAIVDGKTVFQVNSQQFTDEMMLHVELGVKILGGCCGTTPEFIHDLSKKLRTLTPIITQPITKTVACSSISTVEFGTTPIVIGERINPTGKPLLKEAIISENYDFIISEAIAQKEAGANILDINVGLPIINETEILTKVIKELQSVIDLPLQLDSSKATAIEAGVRAYNGKPIINSVTAKESHMNQIFPIVKKYGAMIIALTMDERGIPKTASERVLIAEKIITTAEKFGIPKNDILIDCLVLTASAQQENVLQTLEAVRQIKDKFGVKTVLGTSNVSHGLPQRKIINRVYLAMAFANGLDATITDPTVSAIRETIDAYNLLANIDHGARAYIERYKSNEAKKNIHPNQNEKNQQSGNDRDFESIIIKGLKSDAADATRSLLNQVKPMDIVEKYFIPALDQVGLLYESGELFLPQLIRSAETVKMGFNILKEEMLRAGTQNLNKGTIILATVQGDVHDIGKNIVKILLENYGYHIIDLGKDVSAQKIINQLGKTEAKLVGLSSLMTTTVESSKEIIKKIRQNYPACNIMVGGAVLNQEYSTMIGADFYGKDARQAVEIAKQVFMD